MKKGLRSHITVQKLLQLKVVAVIRGGSDLEAVEFARSAFKGGIVAIEMTATTPNFINALSQFKKEFPTALLGLGTVLNKKGALTAIKKCQVDFIVSPCYVEEVAKVCSKKDVLYIPGCMSVKEIYDATKKFHHPIVKLFPSNLLTPNFIASIKNLLPNISFMPTGGIDKTNCMEWFKAGAKIIALGGNLTGQKDLNQIKQDASEIVEMVKSFN